MEGCISNTPVTVVLATRCMANTSALCMNYVQEHHKFACSECTTIKHLCGYCCYCKTVAGAGGEDGMKEGERGLREVCPCGNPSF